MTNQTLANKTCVPCHGGIPALRPEELAPLLAEVRGWTVVENHHLRKDFPFESFAAALAFVNQAGQVAEEQGHHPEITVGWGHALVEIWTHAVDGLTENDFVLAAKFDALV